MSAFRSQVSLTLRWAFRDRLFHAVLGVALVLLLLVPVFSAFSMRQVQELALTLALAFSNLVLVVIAVLLGTTVVWREIEKKYSNAVLALPISRSAYLLGKFFGVALFLILATAMLAPVIAAVVMFAASTYPSATPIPWLNLCWALLFACARSILLAAFAMFFSAVGTSFFLPFFATFAIYLAGGASQEVYEYVTGEYGQTLSSLVVLVAKGLYFLLPNLAAFDLQVYAIYGIELPMMHVGMTGAYFLVYTAILLGFSLWSYDRRQLV